MTNPNNLNCSFVNSTPVDADWAALKGEDFDGWRAFEAFTCDCCGRVVVATDAGEVECREALPEIDVIDDDGEPDTVVNECTGTLYPNGPVMDYYYPIQFDQDSEEAAKLLINLPVCIVEFDNGKTGLGLTGGGMDLSWEICEAYILLGCLPPLHFSNLPQRGDRGTSARDLEIVAACVRSCQVAEGWAKSTRDRLESLVRVAKVKANPPIVAKARKAKVAPVASK